MNPDSLRKIYFNLSPGSNVRSRLFFTVIGSMNNQEIRLENGGMKIQVPFVMTQTQVWAESSFLADTGNDLMYIFGNNGAESFVPFFRGTTSVNFDDNGTVTNYTISKTLCSTSDPTKNTPMNSTYLVNNAPDHYTMMGITDDNEILFVLTFYFEGDDIILDGFCANNDLNPPKKGSGIGVIIFLEICRIFNANVRKRTESDARKIEKCKLYAVRSAVTWWERFFFIYMGVIINSLYLMELNLVQPASNSAPKRKREETIERSSKISENPDTSKQLGSKVEVSDNSVENVVKELDLSEPTSNSNSSASSASNSNSNSNSSASSGSKPLLISVPLLIPDPFTPDDVDFFELQNLRGELYEGPKEPKKKPKNDWGNHSQIVFGDSQGDSQDDNEEGVWEDMGEDEEGGGRRKSKKTKRKTKGRKTKGRKTKRRNTKKRTTRRMKRSRRRP